MVSPKQATISKADRRIWEIDFLRGILIIGMIFDHFMFFLGEFGSLYPVGSVPEWLVNVGNFAHAYWWNEVKTAIRFIGVLLFFFLVGVSSKFSKSNLKRALICTGCGIALSLIFMTYSLIFNDNHFSLIGVITCLGLAMLIYWAGKALHIKIHKGETNWKWWALGIGISLLVIGITINLVSARDSLRFGRIFNAMWGEYNTNCDDTQRNLKLWQVPIIIIGYFRWGSDWLSILPFLGMTFIGGFIGENVYSDRRSIFFRKDLEKNKSFNETAIRKTWLINWMGAKTFIIYFLHPVVIILLLLIVFSISCLSLPVL